MSKHILKWLLDISERPQDMFDIDGNPTDEWNRLMRATQQYLHEDANEEAV